MAKEKSASPQVAQQPDLGVQDSVQDSAAETTQDSVQDSATAAADPVETKSNPFRLLPGEPSAILRAPADIGGCSVDGVQYDVIDGLVEVHERHASTLIDMGFAR